MKNIKYKYKNLVQAYGRLKEACELYDKNDDMIRDSIIQRFEFTCELTHRTLFSFMKYQGINLENTFPRSIYKKAYINNIISNDKMWIKLLEDRNSTSHMYSQELANEVAKRIVNDYLQAIEELVDNLGEMIND